MRCALSRIVSALLILAVVGCGSQDRGAADYFSKGADEPSSAVSAGTAEQDFAGEVLDQPIGDDQVGQPGEAAPNGNGTKIERQIIYTATLNVIVEDFTGVPEEVEALAERHGGFVAGSSLQGSSGEPRSGSWTVRVPVKQYGTFLEEAKKLGEFQSLTTESQEVTAEYYDVQTRIQNKQKEEARLLTLLEEQTGKLEEVLKVEEHLARVRSEIERLQGRMRVLKDLTAFSTVTLNVNEIKGYIPPEAPTFGSRIARAWSGTLEAMLLTGQNAVIAAVAVGPWLIVLAIPVLIVIGIIRALFRRRAPQ